MAFYVYILASARNGTLYVGATDDLDARMAVHRDRALPGFTAKYGCTHLVWSEAHDSRHEAFVRERQIKKWNRAWKLRLIERENPHWADLYEIGGYDGLREAAQRSGDGGRSLSIPRAPGSGPPPSRG